MKKVKQANGYAIYQALTERDAENYGCSVGNYNIYTAQDIRDYGLAYSYAQWDDIDSLATALELCNGSNYAIACALADELSDSTIQDMDLILEIERCLDSGETIEHFCDRFDRDTGILYPTREAYEAARDDAALADDDLDGDLEDIFEEALSAGDRADKQAYTYHTFYAGMTGYVVEQGGREVYTGYCVDEIIDRFGFNPHNYPENHPIMPLVYSRPFDLISDLAPERLDTLTEEQLEELAHIEDDTAEYVVRPDGSIVMADTADGRIIARFEHEYDLYDTVLYEVLSAGELGPFLDRVIEDDPSKPYGGPDHLGETVAEFLLSTGETITTLLGLNSALRECGCKPIPMPYTSQEEMRNLRDGDVFWDFFGLRHVAAGDAHPSGDASYDGYIVYDTNGDSYFEEEFAGPGQPAAPVDRADLLDYIARNYEDPTEVFSCTIDEGLRQELIAGIGSEETRDEIEGVGMWGLTVLEIGYADIEINITRDFSAPDAIVAEYFVCLKEAGGDWHGYGYIDRFVSIDWSDPDWKNLLRQEMRYELHRYAREQGWDISTPFPEDEHVGGLPSPEEITEEELEELFPTPKPEHRSHASYYVVCCDGEYITCTCSHDPELRPEWKRNAFFRDIAERIAFSDCSYDTVEEIVWDGEPCVYTGWQPGMLMEFRSEITGEIIYSNSFPEWDH